MQNLKRALREWIRLTVVQVGGAAATYNVLLSIFLILRFIYGEQLTVVALLNHGLSWLLLGGLCCGLLTLLVPRHRMWAWYALPALITFIVLYTLYFVPRFPIPQTGEAGQTVQVATFNIRLLNERTLVQSTPLRWAVIDSINADIVGLQEMQRHALPLVENNYPYYHVAGRLALLSRYPFDPEQVEAFGQGHSDRLPAVIRATVDVDGQPLIVYVAHLVRPEILVRPPTYDGHIREATVKQLAERIGQERDPVILLCDCNLSDTTADYRRLRDVLRDSWRDAGFGFGFTAPADPDDTPFPLMRSDYIWYANSISLLHVENWKNAGGSDHFPVVATIQLN